jgi:hypothetical protein
MRAPSAASRLRIIVTGIIAQHPGVGGVAWDYGQYALGLKRLGHDVYYMEDSGEWPYNTDGGPSGDDYVARDCVENVRHLGSVMSWFGLGESWAYRFPLTGEWYGMSAAKRTAIVSSADLLVNVSGTLEHPGSYRSVRRLAYIDSDPVFTQVKILKGSARIAQCADANDPDSSLTRRVQAHDIHFSFGERIQDSGPRTPQRWRPTRQPIVLSEWHPERPRRNAFTTVMNWTSYEPVVHECETYGQKDREFARFLSVAGGVEPLALEIAMGRTQHTEWEAECCSQGVAITTDRPRTVTPHELLGARGWRVVDANSRCGGPESYRDYIEASAGEWSVAKHGYVARRPGWFSCRSACYLAAGRPVVTQDTGFTNILPVGEGLLAFREPDGAIAALKEVDGAYDRHAQAARALAEAYFDSATVLSGLVEEAMTADI